MTRTILSFIVATYLIASPLAFAQAIHMKDTPADTGFEPNPDPGPMWVSEDIWVLTSPDPGYRPYPFTDSAPPWPLPANENPEYRDPKYSVPNYVYVRIHNASSAPSAGTERLRIYWAKASTGLSWPTQWGAAVDFNGGILDYMANNCGPTKQFGAEITKPRRNAATATQAERDAYRDAVLAIGTTPSLQFPDNDYWHKQNEVHSLGPTNRHGSPAFLPWHREFVNRYEVLLQEFDPTVKLLYWDWTTNPETGSFNLDTSSFMGASGSLVGGAFIGSPFNPPSGLTLVPPAVVRNLGGNTQAPSPTITTDTMVLIQTNYPAFRTFEKGFSTAFPGPGPHDYSHVYVGGVGGISGNPGNMSNIPIAAQDPFFFLLHGNVDRLWAQWQQGNPSRLDPASTFGTDSTNPNIQTVSMGPWDGIHFTSGPIRPWTTADGYIVTKLPSDPSVVSPPVYDVAPLTIPVLNPGQAVVMQIPWYPPNPADFACFGGDQGHFCLIARIETATATPFGMTFPETSDVTGNVRNNNKIVWKNVTVVDNFPGAQRASSILVRNPFKERVRTTLRFADTTKDAASFSGKGRLFVDLKPVLFKRWIEGGQTGRGVKAVDDGRTGRVEILAPGATIDNLVLEPEEVFGVDVVFQLPKDYPLRRLPSPEVDLIQLGTPGKPEAILGGQRFTFDFSKIVLVKRGDDWRYWDHGSLAGKAWTSPDYDDRKWKSGKATLGFGRVSETTLDGGPRGQRHVTTYFRHSFTVDDPSFNRTLTLSLKRDDGAVVYLNGKEIHRVNLPAGKISPNTPASRDVSGIEAETFFSATVNRELLRRGANVLAAEVHLRSPRSDDLLFDAELSANHVPGGEPANVAIATPPNGALVQLKDTVPIRVEAVDGSGVLRSLSVFVDGKPVGSVSRSSQTVNWEAETLGLHHITAVAIDNNAERSEAFVAFTVVENTPPTVSLTQPREGSRSKAGEKIVVTAEASDRGGSVARVEFWVREADFFMSESKRTAVATKPPFAATIKELPPGHYMLWAVAVDNLGLESQSVPIHIMVH
jgi:hypothetical protein